MATLTASRARHTPKLVTRNYECGIHMLHYCTWFVLEENGMYFHHSVETNKYVRPYKTETKFFCII